MREPVPKAKHALTQAITAVRARPGLPVWLMAGLLAVVTVSLYWPATHCDFVLDDDPEFLTENPHVQGGLSWEGVKWAFGNTQQAGYWAPLMWLSHMLAWHFFGMHAWGHHLVNVLLHAANTTTVFLAFRRLTRATWRSLMVAALFGLHPLRVESVVWVTERKDVLSMLFLILTLWAYARYVAAAPARSASSRLWYGATVGMFVMGLMSKPALAVTLPCLLLLLDYWPLRRMRNAERGMPSAEAGDTQPATPNPLHASHFRFRSAILPLLLEKLPFLALAALAGVMTVMAQKRGGNLVSDASLAFGARTGNALISYCRYLGKLWWPRDLAVFYPFPGHWPLAEVLLAGGLILGLSVLFFVQRGPYPYFLMGWLWFLGALVPVVGLVQAGPQAMADRFTYVPSLGVLIVAIWGASELTRPWRYRVMALSVASGTAIVLWLALTRQQIGYWKDTEALFRHALQVTADNYYAHNDLGVALGQKGQIDEAICQYQEALRLKPDYAHGHNNLGIALYEKGRIDDAISQYQAALRLSPDYALAHNNLGAALSKKGQIDEAIRHYQEALRLKPDHAEAHNNLGAALYDKGQIDEAIGQYQAAVRLKPDYALAHNNLGAALCEKGRFDEAIRQYQEALRLKPDYAEGHYNLGNALGGRGQTDEAIREYQEALRLKADHAQAHNNLGAAFCRQGRLDEAIRQFQEAVRLKPDYPAARRNLEMVLAARGPSSPAPRGATNP
jgi:tetratricopeptide (TPR) repeat protein